ncbi:FAD-dependent monooxygenase [Ktedonospora formicarum]|uniref:FAD-dependent oxidoreductase n=1 Tax=Ktedonospora formicarum TaxID=2778364 RepID=A0A8J3MW00_9CHLR|nr:FAD-dependent monooxygenase [Ktedonospora formicarum]GHO49855.1 FAD-dependent oxidoreductase [Ktedonospora formicarum]
MNTGISQTTIDETTPVLIVGGSLVGLSMALFLRWRGIPSLVVERHPAPARLPRARAINPRTMELFRALDLEAPIRAARSPLDDDGQSLRVESLAGHEIEQLFEGAPEDLNTASPTSWCHIDQDQLETILLTHLQTMGVDVRFNTELVSFEQNEQGVTALLRERTSSDTRQVRASYLVGADGNHSTVRRTLGIARQGPGVIAHIPNIIFEADLSAVLRGRRVTLCYIDNPQLPDGQGFLMPIDNQRRWMFTSALHPERGERREDLTDERCIEQIRVAVGVSDLDVKILPAYPWDTVKVGLWELTALWAEQYQRDRVFLAGDSAHTILPTGAMGASTGIQDAFNLAWKMALVLGGQAAPSLLASYQEERLPVGKLMVEQTMQRFLYRTHSGSSSLIDDASLIFGYRYQRGAMVAELDSAGASLTQHPRTLSGEPGTRAPHMVLERAGERLSTIDLFGRNFVLLAGSEGFPWITAARIVAERLGMPLDAWQISPTGLRDVEERWYAAYGVSTTGMALVRPDGFVAWRSPAHKTQPEQALEDVLTRILGK